MSELPVDRSSNSITVAEVRERAKGWRDNGGLSEDRLAEAALWAADEIERAQRIMLRAVSWLQIKEAAFATTKGPAIIQEMQRFCAGSSPPKKNDSVVYAPCEKHTGMTFRAVVLAGPLFRKVCPACLPTHPPSLGDSVRTGQEGQS